MDDALAGVRAEFRAFVAGGPFAPLWRAVMAATEVLDEAPGLSAADRRWYDAVYEAVYMGADDPVPAVDRADGVVGAAELRSRLRPLAGGGPGGALA